jgi:hypothetical protein
LNSWMQNPHIRRTNSVYLFVCVSSCLIIVCHSGVIFLKSC